MITEPGAHRGHADQQAAERAHQQGLDRLDDRLAPLAGRPALDLHHPDVEPQRVGRSGDQQREADRRLQDLLQLAGSPP